MLRQLQYGGILDAAAGLVFGAFLARAEGFHFFPRRVLDLQAGPHFQRGLQALPGKRIVLANQGLTSPGVPMKKVPQIDPYLPSANIVVCVAACIKTN